MGKKGEIGLLVVSFVMIIFLLCMVVLQWHSIKGEYLVSTDSLETTSGIIISSESYSIRGRDTLITHYYPIEYEFSVDGKKYQSDKVTFAKTGDRNPGFAENYVKKYPTNTNITIYYEEGNPSFSVLEPNEIENDFKFIVIVMILVVTVIVWELSEGLRR